MSSTSFCVSRRLTLPGLPITSERGGTCMFSVTSVPAATMEPAPTREPFSRIAPMPMRHCASIVQPWITAAWPIVTASPMCVSCVPSIAWTTAPSWMFDRRPIRMMFTSPRTTAHIHTLLSSPTSTSPMTCALVSMNAVGAIRGLTPRYGRSTARLYGRVGRTWQPGLPISRGFLGHFRPELAVVEPFAIGAVARAAGLVERGGALLRGVPVAGGDRLLHRIDVPFRVLGDLHRFGDALRFPERFGLRESRLEHGDVLRGD